MTPRTQTNKVKCGMLPMMIENDQVVYKASHGEKQTSYKRHTAVK